MRGVLNLLCLSAVVLCAVYWPPGLHALAVLTLGAIFNELTLVRKAVNAIAAFFLTPLDELLPPSPPADDLTRRLQRIEKAEAARRHAEETKH